MNNKNWVEELYEITKRSVEISNKVPNILLELFEEFNNKYDNEGYALSGGIVNNERWQIKMEYSDVEHVIEIYITEITNKLKEIEDLKDILVNIILEKFKNDIYNI